MGLNQLQLAVYLLNYWLIEYCCDSLHWLSSSSAHMVTLSHTASLIWDLVEAPQSGYLGPPLHGLFMYYLILLGLSCSLSFLQDILWLKWQMFQPSLLAQSSFHQVQIIVPKAYLDKSTSRKYAVGIIFLQHGGWILRRSFAKELAPKYQVLIRPLLASYLWISVGQSKSMGKVRVNVGGHYNTAGVLEDVVHLELPMDLPTTVAENWCGQGQQSMIYLTQNVTLFH